jgi:hypothetical protein
MITDLIEKRPEIVPICIRKEVVAIAKGNLSIPEFREKILLLEGVMEKIVGAVKGDDCAPLDHSFGDSLYRRTIHMPAGLWLTSKIHKTKHFFNVTKGSCMVWDERGGTIIKAPHEGITLAGTKRLLFIIEDCDWQTIHHTDKTDLKEIENEIIAKNFDEVPITIIEGEFEEVEQCHGLP